MMRVDVPEPIRSGQSYKFKIKWWYNINDHIKDGGRSGYDILRKMIIIFTPLHNFSHVCVCIMMFMDGKINSF